MTITPPPDPPALPLPRLALADDLQKADVDADQIVDKWLKSLEERLSKKDFSNISDLFIDEGWWKDQLALTWDTRSINGVGPISKYLAASDHDISQLKAIKPGVLQPKLLDMGGLIWVESGFSFQNKFGFGQGVVRLANIDKDQWKAWIVLTQLQSLKDEGTPEWNIAESGVPLQNASKAEQNGASESRPDHQVVIIGAGQAGLALAAELKNKGIEYLIIDKSSEIGDSWRGRYTTITSHTPVYTDHYPFLPFPSNYPKWLNQEKIVNWQKGYARIMELKYQTNTEVSNVEYNAATRSYRIDAHVNGAQQAITARHVVMATGMFGLAPIIPHFPHEKAFKGQLYHAKYHASASQVADVTSKRIVIVGAGTSAHDIAEDFAEHGARRVTMVQRDPIFALSRQATEKHMLNMWCPSSGMSTAEADLVSHSFPFQLMRTMNVGMTMAMCAENVEMLDAIAARGMRLKRGETGEGIFDYQFLKGGHFYIDQGAWQHIVDGNIQVLSCDGGVVDFGEKGVRLADGREVEADVVVLATGYQRNMTLVRDLMGEKALEKIGALGHLDGEGERIGWWRPTPIPNFWYMTGSFLWTRQFSAILALQIQAVEQGLWRPEEKA